MHHHKSLIGPLARVLDRAHKIVRGVRRVDALKEAFVSATAHFTRRVEKAQDASWSLVNEIDAARIVMVLNVWKFDTLRLMRVCLILKD